MSWGGFMKPHDSAIASTNEDFMGIPSGLNLKIIYE
jgi:hypothetical protein